MVLIDRGDQLALIELMILSVVRMLLAFLLLLLTTEHSANRGGEKNKCLTQRTTAEQRE
jgi:hypothetical protein